MNIDAEKTIKRIEHERYKLLQEIEAIKNQIEGLDMAIRLVEDFEREARLKS